jgi:carbon-monoxide dehydrogenase large subunit
MLGYDEIALEVDKAGRVIVSTVGHSQGQGHETAFAMIVARVLEIPPERVVLSQRMLDKPLAGNHTGGSRTMVGAASVSHVAARKLIEQCKRLAAEKLGAEPSQIEYSGAQFRRRDTGGSISIFQLAEKAPLATIARESYGSTFPNDCHIAEVEIDPDTGVTTIASYVAVNDCGEIINHTIVEGQLHGGVLQGAGQVFGEQVVYDRDSGQLLTGSFVDYFMPRAGLIPAITSYERPTVSRVSPLGVKGMGESGCTASLPALANAVMDALAVLGIMHMDMPLTSSKIWSAIQLTRGPRSNSAVQFRLSCRNGLMSSNSPI